MLNSKRAPWNGTHRSQRGREHAGVCVVPAVAQERDMRRTVALVLHTAGAQGDPEPRALPIIRGPSSADRSSSQQPCRLHCARLQRLATTCNPSPVFVVKCCVQSYTQPHRAVLRAFPGSDPPGCACRLPPAAPHLNTPRNHLRSPITTHHHHVDQPTPAVPPRRPHQTLPARATTSHITQPLAK